MHFFLRSLVLFLLFEFLFDMLFLLNCFEKFNEVSDMAISYKKLWKLLIDKDLKKKDLQKLAGISSASITKLGKNENVNTDILEKICKALNCDIADIMEMNDESKTRDGSIS